jgi:hypothetical protein
MMKLDIQGYKNVGFPAKSQRRRKRRTARKNITERRIEASSECLQSYGKPRKEIWKDVTLAFRGVTFRSFY